MRAKGSRGVWLWPLALVALGVTLLLNNFLLLSGFNVAALWPLALVVLGAVILLRGDVRPGSEARAFAITRGSVESAAIEINAAEIDVTARALDREGRLIAGRYAADSRPALHVQNTHTHLKMDRAATPWLSFADWEVGLSRDLPWSVFVSTSLGQITLDLSGVIVQDVVLASGMGDIRFIAPVEAFGTFTLRSTLGNLHVMLPPGVAARVSLHGPRLFRAHVDSVRYERLEDSGGAREVFVTREGEGTPLDIHLYGTFGDAYLA